MKEKITVGIIKGVARLPLSFLYLFADCITFILYHVLKYRRKVVRENLVSSFPAKDIKEIKRIEKGFYRFLGDQVVETIKLFHISDGELQKRIDIHNTEIVNHTLSSGINAVVLMGHYGNWEWVQQVSKYFEAGAFKASIYHPLSNKLWDKIFLDLRSRWANRMIEMAKAPRVLLNKSHQPWVCGFIADAYTWHKNENNRVEFLNHPTWFIYGSEEIGKKTGAEFFYLEMTRPKRGFYTINLHKIEPTDMTQPYPYTREFWKLFEKTIEKTPQLWLWSHKRWK